jgi:hypothetical protein
MGIRDRLARLTRQSTSDTGSGDSTARHAASAQEALELARYTYLLRVAQPDLLEQVHREAFTDLTVEQRERVFLRLRHDLPEGQRPASSEPAELASAAVAAHDDDHRYLVRMLRRPGQGVTEGHSVQQSGDHSGGLLFAGSVLGPVAATATASDAAAPSLVGFVNSPEAAQVDASVFVRPPGATGQAAWQAGAGGVPGAGGGDVAGGGGI